MVEVEVRQHDVETIDAVEEIRLLDAPSDPGAGIDQDCAGAVPVQGTRGLAAVGGKPTPRAEDRQLPAHPAHASRCHLTVACEMSRFRYRPSASPV